MNTWGLNTSSEAMSIILNPKIELFIGGPIQLHGRTYTIRDIRLFNGMVYYEIEDGLTGQTHVAASLPEHGPDLPGPVAVIRPSDQRLGKGRLDQLPL